MGQGRREWDKDKKGGMALRAKGIIEGDPCTTMPTHTRYLSCVCVV